ncbi:MAG: hypothetical protein H6677_16905 [Candidatus Obscuribacterales bacterium]|nr:hypothetical protein [Cyanobacteria bacterium HKST-UBA01]MCB9469953.1 hypothetical protein [Candidatus Obscuribacterales bacterium]
MDNPDTDGSKLFNMAPIRSKTKEYVPSHSILGLEKRTHYMEKKKLISRRLIALTNQDAVISVELQLAYD